MVIVGPITELLIKKGQNGALTELQPRIKCLRLDFTPSVVNNL